MPKELEKDAGILPAIRLRFAISGLAPDYAACFLALAAQKSRKLYVADFTLAERNLALPAHILSRVFLRNPAYWRAGALWGLARRAGLEAFYEKIIFGGAAAVVAFVPK